MTDEGPFCPKGNRIQTIVSSVWISPHTQVSKIQATMPCCPWLSSPVVCLPTTDAAWEARLVDVIRRIRPVTELASIPRTFIWHKFLLSVAQSCLGASLLHPSGVSDFFQITFLFSFNLRFWAGWCVVFLRHLAAHQLQKLYHFRDL